MMLLKGVCYGQLGDGEGKLKLNGEGYNLNYYKDKKIEVDVEQVNTVNLALFMPTIKQNYSIFLVL